MMFDYLIFFRLAFGAWMAEFLIFLLFLLYILLTAYIYLTKSEYILTLC